LYLISPLHKIDNSSLAPLIFSCINKTRQAGEFYEEKQQFGSENWSIYLTPKFNCPKLIYNRIPSEI
ncbi:MAG TPA: hypothetical protein VLM43_10430, partial [Desulfobacterales bacterium]|nr:hypothetical protein [Desulfobacterales bacterium]